MACSDQMEHATKSAKGFASRDSSCDAGMRHAECAKYSVSGGGGVAGCGAWVAGKRSGELWVALSLQTLMDDQVRVPVLFCGGLDDFCVGLRRGVAR